MNTRHFALISTGAAFTTSSLAYAHDSGSAGVSLYHYMSSPDHVITFGVLGVAALVITVRLLSKARVPQRQEKL